MEKISFKEKLGYGLGDFACNMIFTMVSSYLMFFYTDIAGIGLTSIGVIMLVARVVDAVTDPIMGGICDKTKTKWGKARPYILWMSVPFGIISVLLFTSPNLGQQGKFVYALITYVMFCIVYTALNIPYTTMMSNMTDNEGERLSFNMFKSIGSNLGAFIAAGLTLTMVGIIGKGNQGRGFTGTVIVFVCVGVCALLYCFFHTKERIEPAGEHQTVKESIEVAIKNQPWLLLCLIAFLTFTGLIIRNQGAMYYAKYYLHQESIAAALMSIPTLMSIPIALVMPFLAKKLGKRNCITGGNAVLILGLLGTRAAGTNITLVLICNVIGSLGFGVAMGVIFVMGAETVDYSEWQTGKRPQGLMTAFIGFMVKLGMAAAGVIASSIMNAGGYVENVEQSASSIRAILANYIWVPIIAAILIIIVSCFYHLDREYDHVIADLHQRRNQ